MQSSAARRSSRARKAGFSLMEITCALFVITVGVFGALQMYSLALEKTRAVNEYAIAASVLQNEMETLRALPFEQLADGDTLPFRSATPAVEKLVKAKTSVAVRDRSEGTPGLKEVRVSVAWTGDQGRRIEKTLTTLIANKR